MPRITKELTVSLKHTNATLTLFLIWNFDNTAILDCFNESFSLMRNPLGPARSYIAPQWSSVSFYNIWSRWFMGLLHDSRSRHITYRYWFSRLKLWQIGHPMASVIVHLGPFPEPKLLHPHLLQIWPARLQLAWHDRYSSAYASAREKLSGAVAILQGGRSICHQCVVKFGLDITRIPLRTDGRWKAYL